MFEQIAQGGLLATIGAGIGYAFKAFEERPQPGLIIENIELSTESSNKITEINIPEEARKLEAKSSWIKTLPKKMPYSEFEIILQEFSDKVAGLEELSQGLPIIDEFIKEHAQEERYAEEWRRFLATNEVSGTALNILFSNIAGCVKRNEIKLQQIRQKNPEVFEEESYLESWKKRDNQGNENNSMERPELIARALSKDWYPSDLLEALGVVTSQLSQQLLINQQLRNILTELRSQSIEFASSNLIFVDALLVNNGRTPIAYDNNAVIAISGMRKAFFLIADANHQKISVPPRETKGITLRSEPIDADQFKSLEELQKSQALKWNLTMRIIRSTKGSRRWITSPETEFSLDLSDLRREFLSRVNYPSAQ
jgi:hypothetical protein